MGRWPDRVECLSILSHHGVVPAVIRHCIEVADFGFEVAQHIHQNGVAIDAELVEAGGMLHDVGRAKTHGLDHAAAGATMLRAQGAPEALCRTVERHTGAGIVRAEARLLKLPAAVYVPQTVEECVVAHCDNLIDGTTRQRLQVEVDWLESQHLNAAARRVARLHATVSRLAGVDLDEMVACA